MSRLAGKQQAGVATLGCYIIAHGPSTARLLDTGHFCPAWYFQMRKCNFAARIYIHKCDICCSNTSTKCDIYCSDISTKCDSLRFAARIATKCVKWSIVVTKSHVRCRVCQRKYSKRVTKSKKIYHQYDFNLDLSAELHIVQRTFSVHPCPPPRRKHRPLSVPILYCI